MYTTLYYCRFFLITNTILDNVSINLSRYPTQFIIPIRKNNFLNDT